MDCSQAVIPACGTARLMHGLRGFYGTLEIRPNVLLLPTQKYPSIHAFPFLLFPVGNGVHSALFTMENTQRTQLTALGRN